MPKAHRGDGSSSLIEMPPPYKHPFDLAKAMTEYERLSGPPNPGVQAELSQMASFSASTVVPDIAGSEKQRRTKTSQKVGKHPKRSENIRRTTSVPKVGATQSYALIRVYNKENATH